MTYPTYPALGNHNLVIRSPWRQREDMESPLAKGPLVSGSLLRAPGENLIRYSSSGSCTTDIDLDP
jgi:hypothetical protein